MVVSRIEEPFRQKIVISTDALPQSHKIPNFRRTNTGTTSQEIGSETNNKMPMVTKFALMNLFSTNNEDSSQFEGVSPYNTRRPTKKNAGVRRMSSGSSISSTVSSSDCTACSNFENCGGDPSYNKKNENKTSAVSLCPPSLREEMMKKLEW